MKLTIGRTVLYHVAQTDSALLRHNSAKDLPATVVAAHNDTCANLKILPDGPGDVWKTSVCEGEGPGCWSWPKREG